MATLPWIAIFLAVPAAWLSAARWLSFALLAIGYVAAAVGGLLGLPALLPIALLLVSAYGLFQQRDLRLQILWHALFVVIAIGLLLHLLPGFDNPRVIGPERFTPDAVPFTMYLNLDKPLVGFWLLLACPWITPRHGWRTSLKAGIAALVLTAAACLGVALLLGMVAWAPKWPESGWLWLANNLFLVTFAEEALFRGYIQAGLGRLLKRRPYGEVLALGVASLLFGAAHAAGGWEWVVLGSVAGLGYGLAYRAGGLQASILAHVGLNLVHFSLFTYPALQLPAP